MSHRVLTSWRSNRGSAIIDGQQIAPPIMTRTSDLAVARDVPTLRELTTAKLRDAILSLHFKPNQHLVERELCEKTGVSRTSVREALRHLEAEGLVERRGNRGLFVASVTAEEAQQIYEV